MADVRELRVVPLRCPGCGDNLPAGDHDVIFYCRDCGTAWELAAESLAAREIRHMAGAEAPHFPFWVFPFSVQTPVGEVSTLQGYRELSGSISPLAPERSAKPPLLFVPAFSNGSPQHLLRAGRLLTLNASILTIAAAHPSAITPIVFREGDARGMADAIILASLPTTRTHNLQFLQAFSVRLGQGKLLTIPFQERNGRRYQSELNLEI